MPAIAGNSQCSFTLDDDGNLRVFGLYNVYVKIPQVIAKDIVDIHCGCYNCVAVDRKGNVWSFGNRDYYQRIIAEESHKYDEPSKTTKFLRFVGLQQEEVPQVQFSPPFQRIPNITNVSSVFCGYYHTILIDNDNKVYSFGDNEEGQLGLGHKKPKIQPQLINSLLDYDILTVACGAEHTIFLTRGGDLLSCGSNKDYQLGLTVGQLPNHIKLYLTKPTLLSKISNCVAIACGSYHSLALCSDNVLYSFGDNKSYQLGIMDSSEFFVEKSLGAEVNISGVISSIACGATSSMVIVDGSLWGWGGNIYGQLGVHGNTEKPKKLSLSNVQMVFCCGYHTFVQADAKLYCFGENKRGQLGIYDMFYCQSEPHELPEEYYKMVASPFIQIGATVKSARK